MHILDLFSGTGGWSEAFLRRGHDVIRIDFHPQFRSVPQTMVMDLRDDKTLDILRRDKWDVVLASPPCQCFSLASIRHHFDAWATCRDCGVKMQRVSGETWEVSDPSPACKGHHAPVDLRLFPASDAAIAAVALLDRTFEIIAALQPEWWWIENPRGGMKHFISQPPTTVWYCQYGDRAAKPTHLWGRWPSYWTPRPQCHNGNPYCAHERAPRGSSTGTQGKADAVTRAAVPYGLSWDVARACEFGWYEKMGLRVEDVLKGAFGK